MADSSSQDQRGSKEPCSHCGRLIQVRLDGEIKIHGPVKDRCPGFEVSPVTRILSIPETIRAANPEESEPRAPSQPPTINPGPLLGKLIKRIPKASRHLVASKLTAILDDVSSLNSAEAWERLFLFPRRCLQAPKRGGSRRNLAFQVNQALNNEFDTFSLTIPTIPRNRNNLAARVSAKLKQGDFRGAVRIASSRDSFCTPDERSLNLLREKHPPANPNASYPDFHTPVSPMVVPYMSVSKAIQSFPSGSAGGHDGLQPQHLKDLIPPPSTLLLAITIFVNFVISGKVLPAACPFFSGANLIGLDKSDGGIRPIAIGCTLRRLAAK